MKKIFILGLLSIFFLGTSFAQQTRFGITAGLNVSKLTGEGGSSDFKAGFQAGVVADFGITESFSIMPELLFTQRGAKAKSSDIADTGLSGMSMTLGYLQLPINAAYKFDVGNGSKMFIFAGPYFGYGISAKATLEGGGSNISTDIKFGSNEALKAFDCGVNVGVGYLYDKVFFKLQYNQGLTNIVNAPGSSVKNMNIAVTVGYFFN